MGKKRTSKEISGNVTYENVLLPKKFKDIMAQAKPMTIDGRMFHDESADCGLFKFTGDGCNAEIGGFTVVCKSLLTALDLFNCDYYGLSAYVDDLFVNGDHDMVLISRETIIKCFTMSGSDNRSEDVVTINNAIKSMLQNPLGKQLSFHGLPNGWDDINSIE